MTTADAQGWLFAPAPDLPGVARAAAIARRSTADGRRRKSEEMKASHAERRARQDVLPLLFPVPSSTLECRGGPRASEVAEFIDEFGACPVLECRYNLALWVRENGSVKVEVGHRPGGTLRHSRRVREAKLERMADLVVELADRLGTLCLFDLLPEGHASDLSERRPAMSYEQIAKVLGCSKEAARIIVDDALESLDIAEARMRRAVKRDRQAAADAAEQAARQKRARLRSQRDQLVQIRPRPAR